MDESIESVLPESGSSHSLKLQFTGSGSEYFRIWIVNLLLTIVTLGIYFPWAKVRKLRYFYGNTLVGGEPLGFHGDPKKMLKGYALVAVLFICYSFAGEFSPMAGLIALLVIAALSPALLKSSMQFRLANTSWRALRFHFAGDLNGAYRAMLPLFAPGALIAFLSVLHPVTDPESLTWQGKALSLLGLAAVVFAPWFFWRLKKYQHDNYALGGQQTRLSASVGDFYALAAKVIGLYILCGALIPLGILIEAFIFGFGASGESGGGKHIAAFIGFALLLLVPLFVAVYAFWLARFQDLLWNQTASTDIRFKSQLHFKSMFWLTVKNWVLIAFTFGLYWPFAAIATQRLRVQAMSLEMSIAPEQLVADGLEHADEAVGLAAGDFFGFDIGL